MNPKQAAAEASIAHIRDGMVLGIGTGTTAAFLIAALGTALKRGKLKNIRGIPTSVETENQARAAGIPIISFTDAPQTDLTIDGADEVDPQLNLIKGLGGALLREKIVAQNSKRLIIIADESKVVSRLFEKAPLPIEIAKFSHEVQIPYLKSLGGEPKLRMDPDGKPFVTDNGNYIYDYRFPNGDPMKLNAALSARAGIVDTGLFLGMASLAIIGSATGVREIKRA